MRRLTPLLANVTIGGLARLLVPAVIEAGGERYTYYGMSLFFPYAGCPSYHCYRFVPPLLASLLPLQVIDAFLVTGFVCQVLTATLLWHVAERCRLSRRAAILTVGWYWVVWGPMPMLRDAMLIADPVQALWLVAALLLLLDGRYLLALPVLVSGAGVKESVLTVPAVYAAYLILSGDDVRGKIPWLATLIVMPAMAWLAIRRLLLTAFQYAPPGDSGYLAHPYLFGLWLRSLGAWPHNLGVALVYIFAGFGALGGSSAPSACGAVTAGCVFLRERGGPAATACEKTATVPSGGRMTAMAIAAVAVILIVLGARDVLAARRFTRTTLIVPRGIVVADDDSGAPGLAVSPDGNRVAFVGMDASAINQLWIQPKNSETAALLTGTERAAAPFWSPDGGHSGSSPMTNSR
jgi:hypothetical protein